MSIPSNTTYDKSGSRCCSCRQLFLYRIFKDTLKILMYLENRAALVIGLCFSCSLSTRHASTKSENQSRKLIIKYYQFMHSINLPSSPIFMDFGSGSDKLKFQYVDLEIDGLPALPHRNLPSNQSFSSSL